MKTLEQLAREAGGAQMIAATEWCDAEFVMNTSDLARFRAACRAEAMEEAAQIVKRMQDEEIAAAAAHAGSWQAAYEWNMTRQSVLGDAAAAIREQIK